MKVRLVDVQTVDECLDLLALLWHIFYPDWEAGIHESVFP
jgi:hypothetical protein